MPSNQQVFDYESVTPPSQRSGGRRRGATHEDDLDAASVTGVNTRARAPEGGATGFEGAEANQFAAAPVEIPPTGSKSSDKKSPFHLRRGHVLTYVGLFIFTVFLYIRPYEFIPVLEPLSQFAFPIGLCTLLVFFPSQFALEGTFTARPREVNLVLLLALLGLLSIPLAVNPAEAWASFTDVFVKAVLMFVVIVNVARTERRLKQLIVIAIVAGCILSLGALNDYRIGNFTVEGYRVKGSLRGWMDNPNDMAIHFVMMVPVAVALLLATRNPLKKLLYAGSAVLMMAGTVVTFSRGAFLGLTFAGATFAFKLARRNRLVAVVLMSVAFVAFLVLAPSNYSDRLISIIDHSRDPNGSAGTRQAVLISSVIVALRHPLLGVGMGNFHTFSIRELVSHNAYTQVASEMGVAALVIYLMFIWTPLGRLRQVERETFEGRRTSRLYYLAVGLQAALVAYMVSSFFASVAYLWFIYYFVGFSVCLRRLYESEVGREILTAREARKRERKQRTTGTTTDATTDTTSDTRGERSLVPPESEAHALTR
ncbi:MAG TPA: O-antigen ligase family protein [Pyrinomonadaceae bacterium]|jgi:O-antigen ligase|nr:O-antigen ligase family protein [Pyrinomonadaceae bacterium]